MKKSTKSLPLQQSANSVSWFSVFKRSWQSALRIDRSQITAVQAIRGTIGFVVPLALGVATGHVVEGVSLAGGAATLGAVGLTYTYRARTRTLLLACLGIAFSAFVGSIIGRIDWLAILVLGLWGFGAGLLASTGQEGLSIGIQSVVALIILTHFALDPLHAALQALLMLAGALFQTLLSSIPFPRQRATPERTALAAAYQKLATYASDITKDQSRKEAGTALLQAYTTIRDTNTKSQQGKILVALLEEAERIRLLILVITRLQRNLLKDTTKEQYSTYVERLLEASAATLEQSANDLTLTHKVTRSIGAFEHLDDVFTAFHQQNVAETQEKVVQQLMTYCDLLREQLYVVKQLAETKSDMPESLPVPLTIPQQSYLRLRDTWTTLRANFTLNSVFFRHALRQGVALALATALYRITPLPIERGYWIALTVLLVLRTDIITTFTRGIARLLGTLLGVVLTTIVVATLAPTKEILVLFDALAAFLAFSFLLANYAIFSAFITMEVVFLLTFVEPQAFTTSVDRAINTIIGGVLALLIYLLWPTWEHTQVLNNIVKRIEALRAFFVAVMHAYVNPEAYNLEDIDTRRMAARVAGSNANISVQRSQQEPETRHVHAVDPELAEGLLSAADIIVQSVLSLEAFLVDNPAQHTLPETLAFTQTVDTALRVLATSIDREQPLENFPDVQSAFTLLEHIDASTSPAPITLRFVQAEAKNIVRGVNTMQQLLATKTQEGTQS